MVFILSKVVRQGKEAYLICDIKGNKRYADYLELSKISDVCDFYKSNLGLVIDGKIINKSYTLLGKYTKGKNKEIFYLISDTLGNLQSVSRNKLLGSNVKFTNAIVTDKIIKFKSGSIPLLTSKRTVVENNKEISTVAKVAKMRMNSIGSLGVNTKFIGRRLKDNRMGVIKFPLYSGSYDCINEVVCYELGKLLGFDVAEASIEKYKG